MKRPALRVFAIVAMAGGLHADMESDFRNPPPIVQPYVWWHRLGPFFNEEGTPKKLEAMCDSGNGGATALNISRPEPVEGSRSV